MKPFIFETILSSALLVLVLSCVRDESSAGVLSQSLTEMNFGIDVASVDSDVSVKGYVKGTALFETATARSTETAPRSLAVTARLYPQDGSDYDFVTDEPFIFRNGRWCHEPPLYWPIGASMDILVHSAGIPLDSVEYGALNMAERMRMRVSEDYLQDDILFGSIWHRSVSTSISLPMQHAQAWITVALRNSSSNAIVVQSVSLTDIYTDGILEVMNNYGSALLDWDFRESTARDRLLPDGGTLYGRALTDSLSYLDILIPEQEKTGLVVTYTRNGAPVSESFGMTHARWLAGRSYTYEIEFTDTI